MSRTTREYHHSSIYQYCEAQDIPLNYIEKWRNERPETQDKISDFILSILAGVILIPLATLYLLFFFFGPLVQLLSVE